MVRKNRHIQCCGFGAGEAGVGIRYFGSGNESVDITIFYYNVRTHNFCKIFLMVLLVYLYTIKILKNGAVALYSWFKKVEKND